MPEWNPSQYLKYGSERTQPSRDLINMINTQPKTVLDLGCGPGNSTAVLKEAFPDAAITGIDSSENMLSAARKSHPDMNFIRCSVPDELDNLPGEYDLIFSNACIHWIPGQEELIKAVMKKLSPSGLFAVQIPYIQQAPFYKILGRIIQDDRYDKLRSIRNFHNLAPEEYYDILGREAGSFSIKESIYYHTVDSPDGVIEWYKGSGLKPYLDALGENERQEFLDKLKNEVSKEFIPRENGKIILKMPRIFFTASKR